MPPIQHKREAYWFYFVVSRVYDRWVNPLFWTARMRTEALELARLGPGMDVVDVGAGTGFATEGIVVTVNTSASVFLVRYKQRPVVIIIYAVQHRSVLPSLFRGDSYLCIFVPNRSYDHKPKLSQTPSTSCNVYQM